MSINPEKAKFYTNILLNSLLEKKMSFDRLFSLIVRKYGVNPREARQLYKLLYKILIYYHTIRFLASYHGFTRRVSGFVDYLYSRGFSIDTVLGEARDLSSSLSPILKLSIMYGYPSWFIRDLYGLIPPVELEEMLRSLNERKRWLRVNTWKATIEEALECLERSGVRIHVHSEFKDMVYVEDPFHKIGGNPCIKKGLVIPQDISSYIATRLLIFSQGDFVDACSAPGVKTIQVVSQSAPGRVLAIDISLDRLYTMRRLLETYIGRTPRVLLVNADASIIQPNFTKPIVLIDAPCSNSGAIYSDPAVKIHLSKKTLRRLSIVQKRILENTIRYSGLLYYMTCSIHPAEGEEVLDYIMEKYKDRVEARFVFESHYVGRAYSKYKFSSIARRIHPQVVNGQGFFLAILEVG